jgi:FkbM family methyltransferase
MNVLNYFRKPEYVFRPRQVFRRIRRCWKPMGAIETIRLPWGADVHVHTNENIGRDIYYYGVFDLVVPETISRLLDRGENAIDVGANIGQNCSLMAVRAGPGGKVVAFEPHPEILAELNEHARLWGGLRAAPVEIENVALGAQEGEAVLCDGPEFKSNRGSAALNGSGEARARGHKVPVRVLDSYVDRLGSVGLCKVDVEGHELDVFRGGRRALERHAIRDIIYEDFNPQPGEVTKLLQSGGYEVSGLVRTFRGPVLVPIGEIAPRIGFSHNYVATADPARLKSRFATFGWHCLYKRP